MSSVVGLLVGCFVRECGCLVVWLVCTKVLFLVAVWLYHSVVVWFLVVVWLYHSVVALFLVVVWLYHSVVVLFLVVVWLYCSWWQKLLLEVANRRRRSRGKDVGCNIN